MDDGISAIFIILSTLGITLGIYLYVADPGLLVVTILIFLLLVPFLIYTCLIMISTRWDKYQVRKDWEKLEEMKKIETEFFK